MYVGNVLQKLVEIAVALCGPDTAGISLVDGDVFRWEAVASVCAGARGGTMRQSESVRRMHRARRHLVDVLRGSVLSALLAKPRFVENLLIPFHAETVARLCRGCCKQSTQGRLSRHACHELRNPLSAIMAAAAILQRGIHAPSVTRAVGVIARQAEHISRLTDDLLGITHLKQHLVPLGGHRHGNVAGLRRILRRVVDLLA